MATEDKRREARFRVTAESYASYPGSTGTISDLSMGGVFLHDADPLPVGSTFEFELHLGPQIVRIHGVVRHTVPRTGMGIEFISLSPATKGLLRTCLHKVARGPAVAPEPAKPAAAPRPVVETPPAPASAEEAVMRLRQLCAELRALESVLLAAHTDHRMLREFRDAVDQVRLTAWSVEKWRQLEADHRDPYTVLPFLVNERIRRAAQLAEDVTQDLDAEELTLEAKGLDDLASAINRLHERLSRTFKYLRKK